MAGKLILWVSALVFTGYGMVSLVAPSVPAGYAGLVISNGNAFAEIAAMYGGLQTGIGIFCLLAVSKTEFYRAGLVILVLGIGAIALGRLIGFLVTAEPVTMYTYGAFFYECFTAIWAAYAFRQTSSRVK